MRSLILLALCAVAVWGGPLYDYVHEADSSFSWELTTSIKGIDFTIYNLFMTSQTWMTLAETNQPVWTHWVQVCVPDDPIDTEYSIMYIDGGSTPNKASPPTSGDILVELLCATARTTAVYLTAIPDEPLTFTQDWRHQSRSEDAIIAYTWSYFINNTEVPGVNQTFVDQYLARMPMTKAAVRAMDATQQFLAVNNPSLTPVSKFVVAGASKRGWTTWCVAGVDSRVVGAVPVVAPVGNLAAQIGDMWQSYGEFSFALSDYEEMGVTHYLLSPVFDRLMAIVSPLAFNANLTGVMKFMITDTGDEFFLPDGSNYMWPYLKGSKIQRVVCNAEHSLTGHQIDVAATVTSWYTTIVNAHIQPQYEWSMSPDGTTVTFQITNGVVPKKCIRWHGYNSKARDFRLITCANPKDPKCLNPILWGPDDLVDQGNLTFVSQLLAPQTGWAGHFVECEFDVGGLSIIDPLKLTSGVSIIPQTYPFPPCPASQCAWPAPGDAGARAKSPMGMH